MLLLGAQCGVGLLHDGARINARGLSLTHPARYG